MFNVDNLIADCKNAVASGRTAQAEVRDLLAKSVSERSFGANSRQTALSGSNYIRKRL